MAANRSDGANRCDAHVASERCRIMIGFESRNDNLPSRASTGNLTRSIGQGSVVDRFDVVSVGAD